MNTRAKIISFEKAVQLEGVRVIGKFDPLLPAHAERLKELGRPLIVFVDQAVEFLPLQARLALVAALRDVDYVAAFADEVISPVIDDRLLHARWTAELVRRVHGLGSS